MIPEDLMHLLLPLLAALTFLVACGDDDGGHADGGGHDENSAVADGARTIEVSATSFAFDPATIEAEVDEDIAIELTSTDIEHDFTIDDLDAHVAVRGGETATGGFHTGDEPGTYEIYCSVPGHREAGMEAELVVG